MKRFYEKTEIKGYKQVVDEQSGLEVIGFDKIVLNPGETITCESGEYELGLVILAGTCDITAGEFKALDKGTRNNVFSGKPTTIYMPKDTTYTVTAKGYISLEIGVCKVKADKKYEPFVVEAEEVVTEHRGQLNWQRDVNDIITSKYEGRVDKIVLGETYGCPGQWSSYPSHKHDTDNLPYEVNMEEIRHFIHDIIDADLAEGRADAVATRFPPEPNGYLHIGSAKAIWINWCNRCDSCSVFNFVYIEM